MDRRNFLRSMLGVAAATALPSEVFPFRKIFLPLVPRIGGFGWLSRAPYPGPLDSISAIELEVVAKEIPEIFFRNTSLYNFFKHGRPLPTSSRPFRIALREKFIWTPNEDQAEAIAAKQAQGIDVQAAIDAL